MAKYQGLAFDPFIDRNSQLNIKTKMKIYKICNLPSIPYDLKAVGHTAKCNLLKIEHATKYDSQGNIKCRMVQNNYKYTKKTRHKDLQET